MQHILQCMFASVFGEANDTGGENWARMPIRFMNDYNLSPFTRNIFFDVSMDITEKFNNEINHLDIDVKCNYIIKNHSLRAPTDVINRQILWSKKGVLQVPAFQPMRQTMD